MVAYLKAHPSVRVMLVEKTDRLYRNLKDWVTVDELDVELHFPKEGVVLSRESRSSEKFMHGIKVLMAKNYIDNLSEEARKGMQEKAEQGIWPTKCPLGYRNITGPGGKKIIVPDPAIAPLIAKLFEWYARGDISLKEAARKAHAAGLAYPRSGAKVPVSTIHTILRNRLYTGWFEWNGKLIQGRHEALIPVELWERAQAVLDGRFAKKAKRGKHDFAFSSLIACARCGCAVVGEIKKQRYVYYHCTGYADKCQGDPAFCRRKHGGRNRSKPNSLICWACSGSMPRFWNGCATRSTPATPTNVASTKKRFDAIRRNTSGSMSVFTPCTSISSMGWSMRRSSSECRTSGARDRTAACVRSNGCKRPIDPTWTRACSFSNSPGTRNGCSQSSSRAKNAVCSISCYRTALGSMAM
jgi:DNA invertase Pin-like site-specific DNA recombinase